MTGKITLKLLEAEFLFYQSPKTEKESDIQRAGEQLFAEFGFEGTTTAELAKAANVTERTLFKYFPSKSDLYLRILSGLLFSTIVPGHMADLKKRILEIKPNFKEYYMGILKARYEAVAKEPIKLRLLLGAILYSKDFSEIFGKLWKQNLYLPSIEAFQYFQSIGQIRNDISAKQMTRASFSLGASFLITKFVLAPGYPIEPQDEIFGLYEIFFHGIKK